jgi:hypothetical protein
MGIWYSRIVDDGSGRMNLDKGTEILQGRRWCTFILKEILGVLEYGDYEWGQLC